MDKKFLTTFQAAEILSVSPDAVLKWIKSGKLAARRTPGGHHRIRRESVEALLGTDTEEEASAVSIHTEEPLIYCWEFNTQQHGCPSKCEGCVVFRARALRCYEMRDIPAEMGNLKLFCTSSCDDCAYFEAINLQTRKA